VSLDGIRIAARSLLAHERSLQIVGQNIANVQTPGYSRQTAIVVPVAGTGALGDSAAAGGGATVSAIARSRAQWLERAGLEWAGRVGSSEARSQVADRVEAALHEPGEFGLQATLDRFYSAATALSVRPSDLPARDRLIQAGAEVAEGFRLLIDGLAGVAQDTTDRIGSEVETINRLGAEIAMLNRSIDQAAASGGSPNELMDQRTELVRDLVARTGATSSLGDRGGDTVVSVAGQVLVQGGEFLPLALNPANGAVHLAETDAVLNGFGGSVGALQQAAGTELPALIARFASVRDAFRDAVNAAHAGGKGLDGSTGTPFFQTDAAGALTVNPMLRADARRVAAGDGTAGDGSIAGALGALRHTTAISSSYRALVAEVGRTAAAAGRDLELDQGGAQQIGSLHASETGVNLDEELANLVSLQQAYAASARLLAAFDDVLSTLLQTAA
jgi:flagellar hook-associated protein 1 FlgK